MGKITDYTTSNVQGDTRLLGSYPSDSENTKNFTVDNLDDYLSSKRVSAPASASDPGVAGSYAVDSDYIYVCIATDTWKRASIATW